VESEVKKWDTQLDGFRESEAAKLRAIQRSAGCEIVS
jgi:hypothetical protein